MFVSRRTRNCLSSPSNDDVQRLATTPPQLNYRQLIIHSMQSATIQLPECLHQPCLLEQAPNNVTFFCNSVGSPATGSVQTKYSLRLRLASCLIVFAAEFQRGSPLFVAAFALRASQYLTAIILCVCSTIDGIYIRCFNVWL